MHAGAGTESGTLVNRLVHHFAALSGVGGSLRPGIVHRLDKGTSGVLLVARDDAALKHKAKLILDAMNGAYLVGGLVGQQRYVGASHDDARPLRAKSGGKIIGMVRAWSVKGDANDVRPDVPIDLLGFFIHMSDFPMRRHSGGEIGHGNLLEIQEAGPTRGSDFIGRGRDQEKFGHRCLAPLFLFRILSGARVQPVQN